MLLIMPFHNFELLSSLFQIIPQNLDLLIFLLHCLRFFQPFIFIIKFLIQHYKLLQFLLSLFELLLYPSYHCLIIIHLPLLHISTFHILMVWQCINSPIPYWFLNTLIQMFIIQIFVVLIFVVLMFGVYFLLAIKTAI